MAGSSLGTAWIQIKPTTTGITASVKNELKAVEAQFTGGQFQNVFKGFGSNLHDAFAGAFKKINTTTKTMLAAGVGSAVGLVTSSISSAVSRIDTLNNAPRVFTALGYAAEDVSASMDDLNSYLDGLPTTLDGAIRNVQQLSASFGGIQNGTKYFKALNDAGLAFGASTEMIENGITQLSQLDLNGPLDAQTWNSLRNSGFSPVFAAMAKEAGITVGELKESFGNQGDKTVKDFLDTLVEMDEKGSGSMSSLADMARANTDGIATSFKNAKTAITRGVADSIKSIPNLTSSVLTAGKSIEKVLKGDMGIDEATKNINSFIQNISTGIMDIATKILPLILNVLPELINTIVSSITEFLSNEENRTMIIEGFVKLFVAVAKAGSQIAQALIPMIPELIGTIVSEITKPENIGELAKGMGILFGFALTKTLASNIWSNVKTGGSNMVGKLFGKIFSKDPLKEAGTKLTSSATSLGTRIANTIKGIAEPIKQAFVSIGQILGSVVNAVMEPLKAVFKGVGEALAGFFTALANPQIAVGALMFVAAAASIAAAILMIGGAIGVVTPAIAMFFNDVLMPLGTWLVETLLLVVNSITDAVIRLTNEAVIPLATFFAETFIAILQTISNVIVNLTQGALIPLINTLSGAFTSVLRTVGDIINNVLKTALEGIKGVIEAVGTAFERMGSGIRSALEGVSGVINAFANVIETIGATAVGIIAVVNGRNVEYGKGYAYTWAEGGKVTGPGSATSDSIPARLSNGEYVIRAAMAQRIGYDTLDDLNQNGRISGGQTNYFTINGYNKSPDELANIISRKIAFNQRGVIG